MAEIWHDETTGAWLAEMRSTAYAFGPADGGATLRHLHWGAPLPREALAGLLTTATSPMSRHERQLSQAPGERPDEYVPWGGLRFDEPSLEAEFGDGTRGVEWRVADQRVVRQGPVSTLEVDLTDTAYPLRVTLAYRVYEGFDVLERWATLRHDGGDGPPLVLRQAHSANWWLPPRGGWRLRYLHGGWGAENQLAQTLLTPGKVVLESRRGTTSHQLNPWFTLDPDGTATEEHGEVWSGALAWSGSWKLVFETTAGGHVHACGGVNDFDWSYRLSPGEELVLPRFAGLYATGGFGAASREWHAWQLAHVLGRGDDRAGVTAPGWPASSRIAPPRAAQAPSVHAASVQPRVTSVRVPPTQAVGGKPPLRPVLYNSWEATSFNVNEAGQIRLAELAARLGIETFVMDDGWFGERHNDRTGLGDWTVNTQKFPRGLGPLIDRVNELGLRFGLWVEPEMVNPDSDLYRAHPDWVFHFDGRSRTQQRNQLVLNLARPDVAEWMFITLDRLLSENRIEFVKWDMNRSFSEPGWPSAFQSGDNPERAWTDYVHNLYAVFDALRAAHPGVEFESCASGGGRVDLGILRRVEQVWTSDNTDAWDRVKIQEGFTQAYPPQAMMDWVTDSPNFLTRRELPLSFRFHVAMAGALGVGGDLLHWTEAELAEAAELIAAYKEIRPVVQRGRLYRLASVSHGASGAAASGAFGAFGAPGVSGAFAASQYVAGDDVVLLAWWGPQPCRARPSRIRLAGLDAGARYREIGSGQEHWGAALLADGLPLPEETRYTYGSTLIRLVRD